MISARSSIVWTGKGPSFLLSWSNHRWKSGDYQQPLLRLIFNDCQCSENWQGFMNYGNPHHSPISWISFEFKCGRSITVHLTQSSKWPHTHSGTWVSIDSVWHSQPLRGSQGIHGQWQSIHQALWNHSSPIRVPFESLRLRSSQLLRTVARCAWQLPWWQLHEPLLVDSAWLGRFLVHGRGFNMNRP